MTTPIDQLVTPTPTAHPRQPRTALAQRTLTPVLALVGLFLLWVASDIEVPALFAPWTGRLQGFVTVFLGIFIEAVPFLLAGVLVSSFIALFVTEEHIRRYSPRNPLLAAIGGSLLGLVFPVCECGSIPAARRLISKGVQLPAGIAFLLAAPVINPIVMVSTYVAFGSWEIVTWRIGLTMLFAVIIGLLVGAVRDPRTILTPQLHSAPLHLHEHHAAHEHHHEHGPTCNHDHHHEPDPQASILRRVLGHANLEFFEMARYLIAGALLAAALQTLIPQQALLALGTGPVVSVLVLMALAAILSICSTVDSFIALSFVNTFTPGSIVAFLVFGPMIDIKSTLMLTTTVRRRIVAIIVLLCFQLVLLAGIVLNFYFL